MRAADSVVSAPVRRASVEMSRHASFVVLVIAAVAWFWGPLATVVSLSLQYGQYEHYSHIVAIPFMSLFILYIDRNVIFAQVETAPRAGALVIAAGIAVSWLPRALRLSEETGWSVAILSMVVTVVGAFMLCYGLRAFKKASFGLLLLVLMAPFPPSMLQAVVRFLQRASAEATAVIFDLIGLPFFRQGFLFSLPGLNIHIAEECSGIRSTLALFIMSLVTGHLFLRWRSSKIALALVVIPLAIVKNAVRIVVLSLLAIYVDPNFITGHFVHRSGGIPLFVVSFAILGAIVWLLQRSEERLWRGTTKVAGQPAAPTRT